MSKRPISVTVPEWSFIAVGGVAPGYHRLPQRFDELRRQSYQVELVWICSLRVLALVAGVFILKNRTNHPGLSKTARSMV